MANPFHKQFQDAATKAQDAINHQRNMQILGQVQLAGNRRPGGPNRLVDFEGGGGGGTVLQFPSERSTPPGQSGQLLKAGVRTLDTVARFNKIGDAIAATQLSDAKAGGAKIEAEEADIIKTKNRQGVLNAFIGDIKSVMGIKEDMGSASGAALDAALDNMAFRMGIEPDEMDEGDIRALLQGFLDTNQSLALRAIPPTLIKIMKLRVR